MAVTGSPKSILQPNPARKMTRILSPVVLPTSSDTDVPEPVYVDIPSVESLTSPESPFINVGQFADYDQALAFARKTFGADQYGRVHLLSSENDPGNTRPGEGVEVPPTGIFTATNRRTLRIIQQKLIDLRTELATLAQVEGERLSVRNEFTKTGEIS